MSSVYTKLDSTLLKCLLILIAYSLSLSTNDSLVLLDKVVGIVVEARLLVEYIGTLDLDLGFSTSINSTSFLVVESLFELGIVRLGRIEE